MLAAVVVGAGGGPPVGAFATSTLAAVSTVIGEDDVVPIGIANCDSFPHLFPISGGTNVFMLAIIFIIIFPVWASVVIAFSCSFCCMRGTRVLCWREGTCFPRHNFIVKIIMIVFELWRVDILLVSTVF